jgi:hypothetical protein
LDFKTEPTHCKHIRTAKHKIDQISSPAPAAFRPVGGIEEVQNMNGRRPAAASATGLSAIAMKLMVRRRRPF